ncbi:MAG TPA: WYL domain-containing protein [Actinomycetota bacterium]|nr:WYL domain-containing protein [Actinomycetota bacterium]
MAESLNDRLSRLLLLVPYVLSHPGASVDEVCSRFEMSRGELASDINLLFLCGLPGYGPGDLIEAEMDEDQVSIRMADYFARPMRLTAPEALVLLAGAEALAATRSSQPALERAVEKLKVALGEEIASRVTLELETPRDIDVVREALDKRNRLQIQYQSQSKDELTNRKVDPWALFAAGPAGRWYLLGWCHQVKDERIFRLDRMRKVQMLDEQSELPVDLDLTKYENVYVRGPDAVTVRLAIAPSAARWMGEYYPLDSEKDLDDGWKEIELSAGGTAWLERLLLRLGPQARVLEPQWLMEKVEETACRLAGQYA